MFASRALLRRSAEKNSAAIIRRFQNQSQALLVAAGATSLRFHGHSHGDGTVCHHDHGHSHGDGSMCYHDHGHSHNHGHSHGDGSMCYHDHSHGGHGGFVPPQADPKKIVDEDHPLMVAARAGDAAAIRKLAEDAKAKQASGSSKGPVFDVNCYQPYMITPLHEAADLGHTEACRALLELGANIDAQMQDGQSPLHVAAFNGHADTVSLLLELHADYEVRNELNYSPLHSAIAKGHIEVMKRLLAAGADIDDQCMDGLSTLQLAILFAATPNPTPITRATPPAGTNTTTVSQEEYLAVAKFLIQSGVNLGAQDDSRRTVLHTAAERNAAATVKLLLDVAKSHPDPKMLAAFANVQTVEGVAPIHIAAAHDNVEICKLLIEAGASANIAADQHTTPLHTAAGKGSLQVLEHLLQVRKAQDGDAWPAALVAGAESTAIHFAAQEGHVECVQALLDAGCNVNATIGSGDTPLHLAASGGHSQATKFLIEKGASLTAKNSDGILPIHTSASHNSSETLKVLIDSGADVLAVTEAGWTPIHIAASNGADQSVWLIVETIKKQALEKSNGDEKAAEEAVKAAVNATIGDAKWTALHLAAQGNHGLVVEALLESGADATALGANSLTALHFAAQFDDINSVILLLKKGANPSAADQNGRAPLHVAAMFEHPQVIRKLMEVKADTAALVKGTDGDAYSALHIAASAGHQENIEILVAGGAAVNIESAPGKKTPLHVAALAKDLPVVLKLIALGADPSLKSADGKTAADLTEDEQIVAALTKH